MIKITLPFPPRDLSPNERPHWAVKAAAAKNYRHACYIKALQARNRKSTALEAPVKALVTFSCGSRVWDLDNCIAAFKPGMDGIVDSGLIPDDNPGVLKVSYRVAGGSKRRNVTVELEEAR